ncbi:MAG: DUF2845 domain-containing protein [Pseudomonadota bacterium]
MNRALSYCFGAAVAAFMAPPVVGAEFLGVQQNSMRCGRDIVRVGQQAFQLIEKCGQPAYRDVVALTRLTDVAAVTRGDRLLAARDSSDLVTEQWVYKPGRGRLTRVLTVTGGVLTDIRLHERQ